MQSIDPVDDSATVVLSAAFDTDNGFDDSALPAEKIYLTDLLLHKVALISLPAPALGLPVSSFLIRAPPVMLV
ncbi:hypothetical protein BTA35_0213625 [Oceanospirillum linum]|uniref:Uncharacterized protein n=1 Tax=Oceanospirillum linum TaxID=966 RepID=A0A1T1H9X3_OCELI|nr:hypothetical protein BTA35_0213625 [Oceanospirillum linum]